MSKDGIASLSLFKNRPFDTKAHDRPFDTKAHDRPFDTKAHDRQNTLFDVERSNVHFFTYDLLVTCSVSFITAAAARDSVAPARQIKNIYWYPIVAYGVWP